MALNGPGAPNYGGGQQNFALTQNARQRAFANGVSPNTGDPGWAAFWEGMQEAKERAAAQGLGFTQDYRGVDPGSGGADPTMGRFSLAQAQANPDLAGVDPVTVYQLQRAALQAHLQGNYDQLSQSIAGNEAQIQQDSDRGALDAAMSPARSIVQNPDGSYSTGSAPAAPTRDQILAALPGHLQPAVAQYFQQQDAAKLANQQAAAKTALEQAQAQAAIQKASGAGDPFGPTGANGIPAGIDSTTSGDKAIARLPPAIQNQVKMLATGRMPFPSSMALKTPYWQDMLQAVGQYDPTFDSAQASNNARVKVRSDFTSGKSAQQINAINTAIGHLAHFSDVANQINNGGNDTLNAVENALVPGGSKTGVALNNFNTLKNGITSELTRVWRQSGGSEQDIKDWASTLGDSKSPAELHGALNTIGNMLESKLESLQNQYTQGMGTADINVVAPQARQALDKLEGRAPQAAATVSPAGGLVSMTAPDGRSLRVPASEVARLTQLGAKRIQ